mgnify:CR=1 FL=1
MANTTADVSTRSRPMTAEEKKVILASSAGTIFEWYDFYLYGSLAPILGRHFFTGLDSATATLFALLAFAAGELSGATPEKLEIVACAVELIHAYSLVHDDLPCMDDDDLRRGRPTLHRAYDEATAVLAGDSLHALAFEWLVDPATHADPFVRSELAQQRAIEDFPAAYAGLRVGLNRGFNIIAAPDYKRMLAAGQVQQSYASDNRTNLLQLKRQRIDVYINDRLSILWELQQMRDQDLLGKRLASEAALSSVLEKALLLQRTLLTGKKEPNVAANELAVQAVDQENSALEQEINNLKTELELRRTLAGNSAMAIVQRHGTRAAGSRGIFEGDTTRDRLKEVQKPRNN